MFNIPAITWTLTVVLLLSGSYHLLQATKPHQLTDRVNNVLHALMNILMAAMLWNFAPSTMLAQIAVLSGAALWFIIQAVARPEFKILCAGSQGRLKCLYHSLSMAGGGLMIAMMGGHQAAAGPGTAKADTTAALSSHHAMPAPAASPAAVTVDHSPDLALLLTVFFGAAAVVFIALLLLRRQATKPTLHHKPARRHSGRAEHGLEAVGAAVMAMMFATMA